MAKTQKISCSCDVVGDVLTINVEGRALDAAKDAAPLGTFSRSVNLADAFGTLSGLNPAGRAAIEFGAWTALRNATGSAADLKEAEEAVARRIEAFESNEWGAAREGGPAFDASDAICIAIERATQGGTSASAAAERLVSQMNAACSAQGKAYSDLESGDKAKAKRALVDALRKQQPVIAAHHDNLLTEQQEAALARKKARLAAAAAATLAGAAPITF